MDLYDWTAEHVPIETVRILLNLGAKPNREIPHNRGREYRSRLAPSHANPMESNDSLVEQDSIIKGFHSAVCRKIPAASREIRSECAQVMELLILHGGDVDGLVFEDAWYTADGAARLRKLQKQRGNFEYSPQIQSD